MTPTPSPAHLHPHAAKPRSSWRLVLLTGIVLLAHWAALRAAPRALAPAQPHAADPITWSFNTRNIEPDPAPLVSRDATMRKPIPLERRPAAAVAPKTMPAPAAPQNLEQNQALALEQHASPATETIAFGTPLAPAADGPVSPPLQLAAASTAYTTTSIAAAAPASNGAVTNPPDTTAPQSSKPAVTAATRNYVVPPTMRLKYETKGEVKGFPYHVKGELLWRQDGKTYDARMEISHFLLGSRVQTSTGQLNANGLEPTRFGDKVRSEVAAHFERSKNKVIFSANTPEAPLLPGAQDQLSVLVQLASLLAADPKGFPNGSTLSFQAVGARTSEAWVFTVGAAEQLTLPGGTLDAVRLWRDPTGEYDTKLEIWLAPDVGYLPVRIRLTQANGDYVDQQWRSTLKQ